MNEKILGKNIQLARKKRGLSQERVEKELELPQKAMSRIESGERTVSTLELARLATLFHMRIGDLLQSESIENENPLVALYRIVPGLEKNPDIQNEVNKCIYICREGKFLEELLNIVSKPRISFYTLHNPISISDAIRQGERTANEERKRIGLTSLPIHDIIEIISNQGIWCAGAHLPSEMSGLFLNHTSIGRAILINTTHARSRQRFSCAHEYAHALFDSDNTIIVSNTENANELIEKRANAFASAFLLPAEGIAEMIQSLNKGLSSRKNFAIFDVATDGVIDTEERQVANKQKLSFQDVALIAHRFDVSYQATVYRLLNLGYITQQEREKLLGEELEGRKYLKVLLDPLEEQKEENSLLECELKTHISRLVIEAYRQNKISRGRVIELSNLLSRSAQDILDLVDTKDDDE